MKFLLVAVNAKYIHSNPALYSLRSFAGEKLRPHIEIAEYTINHRQSDILGDIYKRKPDVVAFSCYIWNWTMIRELVAELPKILPRVPIWLGGPEVSFDPQDILENYPMITGIMIGEGEETFRELLAYYVGAARAGEESDGAPQALTGIPGLMLRTGSTGERRLTDMSEIPFLYEDMKPFENRIVYYESSRGCPFRCSYCLSSIEKTVRLRDIEIVKRELQFFLDRQVPQVKFVDRTFNCDHGHAMAIWQYILEHDNGVTNFHFEISGDILRRDEMELLGKMRPGLVQLEIGVQSANGETLGEIRRHMDLEKLACNVETIRQGGNIHQHLDLIVGLPYEDYESFGRSFDRVYAMKPHQLQLGFLKVLKGSHMHRMAQEYGLAYQSLPPYEVLYTRWLSYREVLRLKGIEEMVELYYNSSQFTHTLPFLEQIFSGPFALYEALADFYEVGGYFVSSPSRVYRYQVLLDFAVQRDPGRAQLYREALVFDMYLRENLKSRPAFGADLGAYKEQIRAFYAREEKTREHLPAYEGCDARQLAKMTHLEPFRYPVWEEPGQGAADEGAAMPGQLVAPGQRVAPQPDGPGHTRYVLFDYRERNPLTHEARTVVVEG